MQPIDRWLFTRLDDKMFGLGVKWWIVGPENIQILKAYFRSFNIISLL